MAELIMVVVSLITLIVFFVMGSNIGTLVNLTRGMAEQNKQIITLLKKQAGEEEKAVKDEFAKYKS